MMWWVLLGSGAITIGFSYLFGTKNTVAQVLMTAGLALTIALVFLSILALQEPFAGIARIQPDAFNQLENTFKGLSQSGAHAPTTMVCRGARRWIQNRGRERTVPRLCLRPHRSA